MAPHVFIRDGSHSNPVLRPVDIDNMSYDELLDLERQLGQVRSPGASMEQISELPAFAYHRAPDDKKQSSAAPKSCAVWRSWLHLRAAATLIITRIKN
jgi:hypothetical protein